MRQDTLDGNEKSRISMVVAVGKNRVIGKDNQLLWRIPDDMKRFKTLTSRHPVIMGRKTWESLPKTFRPLPDRTNIVVSRQKEYRARGAVVTDSLKGALEAASGAPGSDEIFIIGGAQLYSEALPRTDRLYLTRIDDEKEGDTYFPPYENIFTKILKEEPRQWNALHYRWLDLER